MELKRKKISLFLFLLYLTTGGQALAIETPEACQGFPDVAVTVTPTFDEPVEDYTRPQALLQQLATSPDSPIQESHVFGLARYAPVIAIEVKMVGAQYQNGQTCGHVSSANIVVGFRDTTIHIANEIPAYSCGFMEVLAHERRHIMVAQEVLNETLPVIQNRVAEYLKLNGVFQGVSADYAKATINEKVNGLINSVLTEMAKENRRRQQMVDTEEEYKRLTLACDTQLGQLASKLFGHH